VAKIIGERFPVQVMNVADQSEVSGMCLSDWVEYWEGSRKRATLNVISLEFSKTKLAEKVRSPALVRRSDWIDNAWPETLKMQGEYPQTQYYCLMSAANSFTDFHVDFGGTAVWYHVVKGKKILFLTAPTPERLAIYERWICDSGQDARFFADLLPDTATCRLELLEGQTLIIPSAWLHAVFTPVDSLVFGGNFLPGLSTIRDQLAIYALETRARINRKFRFPFFTSAMFFGLNHTRKRLLAENDLTSTEKDGLRVLIDACKVWALHLDGVAKTHAEIAAKDCNGSVDELVSQTEALLSSSSVPVLKKLKLKVPAPPPENNKAPSFKSEDEDDSEEEEEEERKPAKLRLPAAWFDQTYGGEGAKDEEAEEEKKKPPRPAPSSSSTSTTIKKKVVPTTAMARLKAKLAGGSSKKR